MVRRNTTGRSSANATGSSSSLTPSFLWTAAAAPFGSNETESVPLAQTVDDEETIDLENPPQQEPAEDHDALDREMQQEERVFEELEEQHHQDEDDDSTWTLRIKCPYLSSLSSSSTPAQQQQQQHEGSGERDWQIQVHPHETVGHVKQVLIQAIATASSTNNSTNNKPMHYYVRLVCKGRLLAPDQATLQSLHDQKLVRSHDVVHAVVVVASPPDVASSSSSPQTRSNLNAASSTLSQHRQQSWSSNMVGGVQAALQQGDLQGLTRRALRGAGINTSGVAVRRSAMEQEEDDDHDEAEEELEFFSSETDEYGDLEDVPLLVDDEDNTDGDTRNNTNQQAMALLGSAHIVRSGSQTGASSQSGSNNGSTTTTRNSTTPSHNRRRALWLQRRGFDRLRTMGLRRGEIEAMRAYFSQQVDRFVAEQGEQQTNNTEQGENDPQAHEDPLFRRRLQEEAWMQAQGPLSEFRLNLPAHDAASLQATLAVLNVLGNSNNNTTTNSNNTTATTGDSPQAQQLARLVDRQALLWRAAVNASAAGQATANANNTGTTTTMTNNNTSNAGQDRDFWCGFLLGFFVGFVMLIWVWMPTVPHKQKLGILAGITVQLALAMFQPSPQPQDSDGNDGEDTLGNNHHSMMEGHFAKPWFQSQTIWKQSGYAHLLASMSDQNPHSAMAPLEDDDIVLG